jgi:hypothetical protein
MVLATQKTIEQEGPILSRRRRWSRFMLKLRWFTRPAPRKGRSWIG